MKKYANPLAIAAVVVFLLLNLVNLFFGKVSDGVYLAVMAVCALLFLPMLLTQVWKNKN